MTGRFAPTPSGRMHIGNMVAMLAAWLDSRSRGRHMLLRIEDIDTPRVLPDADRWIMDDLTWLGMDWDGEPVYQSQRLDLYEQAMGLLPREAGSASAGTASDADSAADNGGWLYPCFCSRADIRAASAPQEGDGFQIYPGTCRALALADPRRSADRAAQGQRHSWRLAMPSPANTAADTVNFTDRVFGPQTYRLSRSIGDSIIRRSDGLFSYQFVVTVDDLTTGVDSIVRGRDLLRSTALQAWIRTTLVANGFAADAGQSADQDVAQSTGQNAGGTADTDANPAATPSSIATPSSTPTPLAPEYAHIPLIDNAAGRRLAKRERSLDMGALRARGVTAEQVTGVCAYLLGLIDTPEPCTPTSLLGGFGWEPLRRNHADRKLDPASPQCPDWLADAVG